MALSIDNPDLPGPGRKRWPHLLVLLVACALLGVWLLLRETQDERVAPIGNTVGNGANRASVNGSPVDGPHAGSLQTGEPPHPETAPVESRLRVSGVILFDGEVDLHAR